MLCRALGIVLDLHLLDASSTPPAAVATMSPEVASSPPGVPVTPAENHWRGALCAVTGTWSTLVRPAAMSEFKAAAARNITGPW